MGEVERNCYGVVIDAGSSGSRIYVYKWEDPTFLLQHTDDQQLLHSVPKIFQNKDWTYKVTPGLSSFKSRPKKAFSKHIKLLLEFASEIIPEEKLHSTPVFIQATAGMRLLRKKERDDIIKSLCHGIKHSTAFLLENCESQIQVIDGEIEGLYGWLSLNYLYGHFNSYEVSRQDHFTFGFMDMGGASTQIAFAPSDQAEVSKHSDDIASLSLRSINGDIQEWNVFVSTWLGFGANEARRRYLVQLINSLPENSNNYHGDDYSRTEITDPCVPNGCKTKFKYDGQEFKIYGSGNYEQCSKSIYPLLLKNMPCRDKPCLFNGVHAPQIDYYRDKFIGTSEYWYTANDLFKLGGNYNFEEFSSHVKEFCRMDWETIKSNSEDGLYNSISVDLLIDSCFKANWILNVLHEGFNLPRVGIDNIESPKDGNTHPLFQSADSVQENELSWTLGKILLYACGSIKAGIAGTTVGVKPSENSLLAHNFLPGSLREVRRDKDLSAGIFGFVIILLAIMIWLKSRGKPSKHGWYKVVNVMKMKLRKFRHLASVPDPQSELELGSFDSNVTNEIFDENKEGCKYRSKSMFNLPAEAIKDTKYPIRSMKTPSSPSSPIISTLPFPNNSKLVRPAFSLADFSKFKDAKFND
ncbi:hypothetical protein HG535_0F02590 [Zygotorulaspora mrakii]|uniref:Golgi apyrase n=1 Tax=Zygotorulaspora mrakii TaxID=42260 RepID=A0A7H9B4Y2_ZYGMR|nr:uncharacterized protein HG535_0F02590 [Zygotorulaspora mrakii]QLG73748.1 hypothetical protein HG535_0F02590 [Zygotorulaspora mrakii]